ncbi:MAG: hypothetical protein KGP28_06055 [Bdellovibrionales bacterium]|nr:hypothetical protein [Bdellovibrionales bacterium]
MDRKLMLFSWSDLEQGRINQPKSDLKDLSSFSSMEAMVQHSLSPKKLLRTHTPEGATLKEPQKIERPFHDETLLQKLIQYRNQIPLSPRIIRATDA